MLSCSWKIKSIIAHFRIICSDIIPQTAFKSQAVSFNFWEIFLNFALICPIFAVKLPYNNFTSTTAAFCAAGSTWSPTAEKAADFLKRRLEADENTRGSG